MRYNKWVMAGVFVLGLSVTFLIGQRLGGLNLDRLLVDGGADAVRVTVQGHSTQTNDIFVVEKSDGTDIFRITGSPAFNARRDVADGAVGYDMLLDAAAYGTCSGGTYDGDPCFIDDAVAGSDCVEGGGSCSNDCDTASTQFMLWGVTGDESGRVDCAGNFIVVDEDGDNVFEIRRDIDSLVAKTTTDDATDNMFTLFVSGEARARLFIRSDGRHSWSDGTNPADLILERGAANLLVTASGDHFKPDGSLIGNNGTVASAATVDLTNFNFAIISGTTNIDSISTCDATHAGKFLTMFFQGVLTVSDSAGNVRLEGGDFATTANDNLSLVCDGTNWRETSRVID